MTLDSVFRDVAELKHQPRPRIEWCTVTQVTPLRIRPDDASASLDMDVTNLLPCVVGDRVAVWVFGTSRLVLGPVQQQSRASRIAGQVVITCAGTGNQTGTIAFPAGMFASPPLVLLSLQGGTINLQKLRGILGSATSVIAGTITAIPVTGQSFTAGQTIWVNWLAVPAGSF